MVTSKLFADRRDAGRKLAAILQEWVGPETIVVGIARGGIPVAFEVAMALQAPLDVIAVRKIGAPGQPEYAVGALVAGETETIDADTVRRLGIDSMYLAQAKSAEGLELARRDLVFHASHPPIDVHGKTVLLIDDGLATGMSALAAIHALRRRGAKQVVLACPVCPRESYERLRREERVEVVCGEIPDNFYAVGQWYEDFAQTSDAEVVSLLEEARARFERPSDIVIDLPDADLEAILFVPPPADKLVVFVHGSGSSRLSVRNRRVAQAIQERGVATLLMDLLTNEEEAVDEVTRQLRFDIDLLSNRVVSTIDWLAEYPGTARLRLGLFGASTGAAAALVAAARRPDRVFAVVSRGGRPDLADKSLGDVLAPTLLIVGQHDETVLELNKSAQARMTQAETELRIVPGATHLFEEPGTLDEVALLAGGWFAAHEVSRTDYDRG